MTTTSRARNPRGSGARLREEILDGAIALIDEGDDAATGLSLRAIARYTGISAPSIYPHFPDLQAVVEAVLERCFAQLESEVRAAMDGIGGGDGSDEQAPVSALLAGCSAYVRYGWEHAARYRLMFAASGFAPNAVETFALVEDAIAGCVEHGSSTSTDPHGDAFLVWVALHGITTLEKPSRADYLRLGALDRPAAIHTLVRRLAKLAG